MPAFKRILFYEHLRDVNRHSAQFVIVCLKCNRAAKAVLKNIQNSIYLDKLLILGRIPIIIGNQFRLSDAAPILNAPIFQLLLNFFCLKPIEKVESAQRIYLPYSVNNKGI